MKRLISILLIVLLISNSFGYLILYLQLKNYFKNLVFEKKENLIPESDLELIIIPKNKIYESLTFTREDEFVYNNKLYDIIKTYETDEVLYFYCICDEDETKLDLAFSHFINTDIEENPDCQDILNFLHRVISSAIIIPQNIKFYISSLTFHIKYQLNNYNNYLEVPTPPPKIFS